MAAGCFFWCWRLEEQDLASKNVHGFTEEQIEKMAATWEPTPAHMLTLDSSVRKWEALLVEQLRGTLTGSQAPRKCSGVVHWALCKCA